MGIQYSDAAGPEGMRIYAIGDVHGRRDLLEIMHARIDGELARDRPADWRIIHLGDYVDRGPDSAGVVEMVSKRVREDSRVLALAGNHETKFLSFLASPEQWRQFADFGGEETAQSYGVDIDFTNAKGIREGHAALVRAVPESHLNFLVNLGYSASFGDFFFCHAGIKPGLPLEQQDSHDLTWIRGEFLNYPALHPKVIVHGHTPHDAPEVMANRVNLDTLAYWSGILTALAIDGAEKRIFNVTGKSVAGGGDAVAIDHMMVGRSVGCIDAQAANDDGGQHCKGQKSGFHGGHLGCGFLHLFMKLLRMCFASAGDPSDG